MLISDLEEHRTYTMALFSESYSPEEVCQFIKGQFLMISDTVMDEIATYGINRHLYCTG